MVELIERARERVGLAYERRPFVANPLAQLEHIAAALELRLMARRERLDTLSDRERALGHRLLLAELVLTLTREPRVVVGRRARLPQTIGRRALRELRVFERPHDLLRGRERPQQTRRLAHLGLPPDQPTRLLPLLLEAGQRLELLLEPDELGQHLAGPLVGLLGQHRQPSEPLERHVDLVVVGPHPRGLRDHPLGREDLLVDPRDVGRESPRDDRPRLHEVRMRRADVLVRQALLDEVQALEGDLVLGRAALELLETGLQIRHATRRGRQGLARSIPGETRALALVLRELVRPLLLLALVLQRVALAAHTRDLSRDLPGPLLLLEAPLALGRLLSGRRAPLRDLVDAQPLHRERPLDLEARLLRLLRAA
ncbi:MAG TPA: hypothetical protein PK095_13175, partial [Myxococcota bacterium]|nr:hypothetical protein [Myxococcota bacterium]